MSAIGTGILQVGAPNDTISVGVGLHLIMGWDTPMVYNFLFFGQGNAFLGHTVDGATNAPFLRLFASNAQSMDFENVSGAPLEVYGFAIPIQGFGSPIGGLKVPSQGDSLVSITVS